MPAPLHTAVERAAARLALRGPLHRLTEALGLIQSEQDEVLSSELRAGLRTVGVKAGRFALFLPLLLKPRAMAMRARLWALQHDHAVPGLPSPNLVSLPRRADWPAGFAAAMGHLLLGASLRRSSCLARNISAAT